MTNGLTPRLESFLLSLSRIQNRATVAQQQVSSGLRIQSAVDDPSSVDRLLRANSGLAAAEQSQKNLTVVQSEVETASNALQGAIRLMDEALTLGTQAAGGSFGDDKRSIIAGQLADVQFRMVGASTTTVNGRFVFSGDLDGSPSYALNLSNPTGVQQLATPTATLQIARQDGSTISVGRTAQDLFDRRDAGGAPAQENIFAALQSLRLAVDSGSQDDVKAALELVRTAQSYLNIQASGYGATLSKLTVALNDAQGAQADWKIRLSEIQDADTAAAIVEMQQLQTQLSATMSAQAQYPRTSLFDFLR